MYFYLIEAFDTLNLYELGFRSKSRSSRSAFSAREDGETSPSIYVINKIRLDHAPDSLRQPHTCQFLPATLASNYNVSSNHHSPPMSGNVRARRPASPPPGSHSMTSQRFPHPRQDHLDADARREAATKGYVPGRTKSYPPGGINITSGEVKLLLVIVLVACGVRFYRISRPNSVVCVRYLSLQLQRSNLVFS